MIYFFVVEERDGLSHVVCSKTQHNGANHSQIFILFDGRLTLIKGYSWKSNYCWTLSSH